MKITTFLFVCFFSVSLFSQNNQPAYTPAVERLKSKQQRTDLEQKSLLNNIPFRSIGPTVFSGRVSDIDVSPDDPSHFYVGYSSGGLWKTVSNGTSFEPLFNNEIVMTIGDIAVNWKENILWVGTGEVNSSRSSYSGVGLFKSTDDGKNWEHMGLPESHHIGRIVLHPTDPNTLWVAVLGHLYSPNQERGVYKTTDGGKTWNRTLFVNQNAGVVDLVIDPADANILYAAAWDRTRRAWNFVESGEGSGIYKSTDGGENWQLLSGGFPSGEGVGRIGLSAVQQDGETVVYAVLDNYFRRPKDKETKKKKELTKDQLRSMTQDAFLKLDGALIKKYLLDNNFPDKYSEEEIKKMIKSGKVTPAMLVEYIEDANSLLFDTPVIGAEVYRSGDGGQKWTKQHEDFLDDVYYSYGYYFGQIRATADDQVYIMGVPALRSEDSGKTWKSISAPNVHSDHHALWINPNRPGHLILGNDGGINISYDNGEHWFKCNTPAVGQFYYVAVDHAEPYNVYGGLQDNGVWMGKHTYKASDRWQSSGQYPYKSIMGGDGMQVAVDTRDNATVYTGFQFGNYYRINTKSNKRKYITPRHELGERPYRWNWQTPIHLSVHNQDILYMGSNKVHRSFNQGDDFQAISDDLTTGGRKGDVAFSTLTALHESPLKFGLLYAGSDDGLLHVSKDAGSTWTKISDALPADMWVARVQASAHDEATVYVAMNGYRWDNFACWVYKSTDYGASWKRLGLDLPLEPANVVKEDPQNANLIYVGTDHGLYASLDGGDTFHKLGKDLPAAPVHDVVVHPKTNDLIVGTHGRSIYLGSVKELQQLKEELLNNNLHLFSLEKVKYRSFWGDSFSKWREPNVPELIVPFFTKQDASVQMSVKAGDLVVFEEKIAAAKGLNYHEYNLHLKPEMVKKYTNWLNDNRKKDEEEIEVEKAKDGHFYLQKGKYQVVLKSNGVEQKTDLIIE